MKPFQQIHVLFYIFILQFALVRAVFPNAKIIIDRFHTIQLISRSLNKTRVSAMNSNKPYYNKLKRYWKLILKKENELDDTHYNSYICFDKLMREADIVEELLKASEELAATYEIYQDLLSTFDHKDYDTFFKICRNTNKKISKTMKTSIKTLLKNEEGIRNALQTTLSNGVIEGTNNLIKVIKRIAFGYRSFVSFKVRILLICNTMIPLHNQKKNQRLQACNH